MASISIKVDVSSKGSNATVELNNLPPTITIGDLKAKLKVQSNAHFGRLNQFENWDNRRSLSDYFVKNGEPFQCVIQCMMEDGQPTFDDYDECLSANKD